MILVTGGAFCGKSQFIKDNYNVAYDEIISAEELINTDIKIMQNYRVISNFEKYIEKLLMNGNEQADVQKRVLNFLEELLLVKNDVIIELREVGAGIVPIDKFERVYREAVGRCGCVIAENADEVFRVVCGVPMKIYKV